MTFSCILFLFVPVFLFLFPSLLFAFPSLLFFFFLDYLSIRSPHNFFLRRDGPIQISGNSDHDETAHPVISETWSDVARIQTLNMADYIHEKVYMNLSQILDLQYNLCDISEKHRQDLETSKHGQRSHYGHWKIRLLFRIDGIPLLRPWHWYLQKKMIRMF